MTMDTGWRTRLRMTVALRSVDPRPTPTTIFLRRIRRLEAERAWALQIYPGIRAATQNPANDRETTRWSEFFSGVRHWLMHPLVQWET